MASVAVHAVDDAVLLARALVVDDGGLRAPEEALAALARDHAIVHARALVAAHLARDDLDLSCSLRQREKTENNISLVVLLTISPNVTLSHTPITMSELFVVAS